MAKIIGLCGRSGSGKGYVCRLFLQYGIPSVDTDALYRKITGPSHFLSPCMLELITNFGEDILAEDGSLDRKKLSRIVFAPEGKDKLALLNKITHKYIINETMLQINRMFSMGAPGVIIDAPALFEAGIDKLCDAVVCVTADENTVIKRIMERDHLSESSAMNRLSAQIPSETLIKMCDYNIDNSDDAPVAVEEQVKKLAALFLA